MLKRTPTPGPAKTSIEALATSVGVKVTKKENKPDSAKIKVETLLRKRDEKKERKESEKVKKSLSEEDKKLVRQQKNKKRAKKRDEAREEDDFDKMFKQHKQSLLKKLNEKQAGAEFEEIEMSD